MKRGPKYKLDIETVEGIIDKFFEITPVEDVTITGLCIHMGIVKDTFYEYAKLDDFKHIINMARLKVEYSYELSLKRHGRAGDIFALKNFGWTDRQELAHTLNVPIDDPITKAIKNGV